MTERAPLSSLSPDELAAFLAEKQAAYAELKDRGVIVQKNVKGKPKVTGDDAASVELSLAPLDVESAFTLCQDGAHGGPVASVESVMFGG